MFQVRERHYIKLPGSWKIGHGLFRSVKPYCMPKTIELTTEVLEILEGLKAPKKLISSKYFYDAEGSRIFQQIMGMPEYYLTNSEAEILEIHKNKISALFCSDCRSVDLVELGAGDGAKTRILIQDLLDAKVNFRYVPVDISQAFSIWMS